MHRHPTIGICGGGNLSHAMAAWLSRAGYPVRIVTRRPEEWDCALQAHFFDGENRCVRLASVSSDTATLADCALILISGPRYAIAPLCENLLPHLNPTQAVVIAPGTPVLLHMEQDIRWQAQPLLGLYKVPFICRTERYGHAVSVMGSRDLNRVWLSAAAREQDVLLLSEMFDTPLERLSSAWPFLLTNSNPLLHPSRLCRLFSDYDENRLYNRNFLFYEEWGVESSELYMAADAELLSVCERCPGMVIGKDIIPVAEYYESPTPEALTKKIRSITAFQGIYSPMKRRGEGWVPDFSSRYFTEDIPYGTALICEYARQLKVDTPVLDSFVQWNQDMLQRFGE